MKTGVENGREATVAAEFLVNGRKWKGQKPKGAKNHDSAQAYGGRTLNDPPPYPVKPSAAVISQAAIVIAVAIAPIIGAAVAPVRTA
jgi:hypothetical protein